MTAANSFFRNRPAPGQQPGPQQFAPPQQPPMQQQGPPQGYGQPPMQQNPYGQPVQGQPVQSQPYQQPGPQQFAPLQQPQGSGFGAAPPVDLRSMFRDLPGTQPLQDQGEFIKPGRFWGVIRDCRAFQNIKFQQRLAIDFDVIHVVDNDYGRGHKVGEKVTKMFFRENLYFAREVMAFVCNTMEVDSAQVTIEDAASVFNGSNPLTNMIVEIYAHQKMSQKTGKMFCVVNIIRPVPAAEVLANVPPEVISRFFTAGFLEGEVQRAGQMVPQYNPANAPQLAPPMMQQAPQQPPMQQGYGQPQPPYNQQPPMQQPQYQPPQQQQPPGYGPSPQYQQPSQPQHAPAQQQQYPYPPQQQAPQMPSQQGGGYPFPPPGGMPPA